jgi:hypothetical protein
VVVTSSANFSDAVRYPRVYDRHRACGRPLQPDEPGKGWLTNWWTDADRAAFEARTAALIAQDDALEPQALPGHHVNGALTIGENIGDLGGVGDRLECCSWTVPSRQ